MRKGLLLVDKTKDQLSSVTNAMKILDIFSNTRTVIYVSEIAQELGLSKSSVSRLVRTLESGKFLEKDPHSQGYILGKKILSIGGILANTNEIYREVSPVLVQVVQETGEGAQVAALDGNDVYYISKLSGPYFTDGHTQIGLTNPFHATGTGKVIMAYQDEERIRKALAGELRAFTEYTITNPIQLEKEFEKIRQQGYSFTVEEMTLGNYSLAFPVRNWENKVICSLSIVGPLSRLSKEKRKNYTSILRNAATIASERLGYEGN